MILEKNQIKKLNKNFDYVINFGGYVDHTRKRKHIKVILMVVKI